MNEEELVKTILKTKLKLVFDFLKSDVFESLDYESKNRTCNHFSNALVNEYYAKHIYLDDESEDVLGEVVLFLDYNYLDLDIKPGYKNQSEIFEIVSSYCK